MHLESMKYLRRCCGVFASFHGYFKLHIQYSTCYCSMTHQTMGSFKALNESDALAGHVMMTY